MRIAGRTWDSSHLRREYFALSRKRYRSGRGPKSKRWTAVPSQNYARPNFLNT